jgi:putative transposase
MVTPAHRREAVAHLETTHEMSERPACRVIGVDRTSVRYQRTTPDDAELRARIKALAHERRRFGYRRLYILLRREGRLVNRKRVQRIDREERLMVRRRGGRKRFGPASADGGTGPAQRLLVARLRARPDDGWPALPHPRHRR